MSELKVTSFATRNETPQEFERRIPANSEQDGALFLGVGNAVSVHVEVWFLFVHVPVVGLGVARLDFARSSHIECGT